MSIKKQIPSLCKIYSKYEEKPEEFLDETDVNNCVYHIFEISQSWCRIVRITKSSKKCLLPSSFFIFAIWSSFMSFRRKQFFCRTEISPLVERSRDSLKIFDETSNCLRIPLPEPKFEKG